MSRIYRWYAVLQHIDRDAVRARRWTRRRCDALLHRLAHVEATVTQAGVPPAYGDLLYDLRGHIAVVRANLLARRPAG